MKQITFSALALLISLISVRTQAQTQPPSLKNTSWKLYIPDLNDSITLHIKTDSSYVTMATGDPVVKSVCKISADTLCFTDYDGQYACPNATGKYKVSVPDDGSSLTLTLIDDPCDNRAASINKQKWTRVAPTAK